MGKRSAAERDLGMEPQRSALRIGEVMSASEVPLLMRGKLRASLQRKRAENTRTWNDATRVPLVKSIYNVVALRSTYNRGTNL